MSLTLDSFRNIIEKCGSFGRVEVSDHPETSHGKILRVYGNTRILGRLKVGIINFFSLLGINQVKSDNQLVREKFLHSLKTDLNAAEKDFFSSQFESSIQGTKALKARHIREAITWHDTIQARRREDECTGASRTVTLDRFDPDRISTLCGHRIR